jgi:2-polyprenyl-6-methoxyphenol hydroxylase-like FAD-dependent oxidoreductase
MASQTVETTCCVVGGGPAGVMLGYLLARSGVAVTVLEKHKDFFRDFRGDTVHPSTLEVMYELDLLDDFLKVPHQQLTSVGGVYGDFPFTTGDFSTVPTHCKFVALMPQWDFLNFLSEKAKQFPGFSLRVQSDATDLIQDRGRVIGVVAQTPEGQVDVLADLVVGCDGRRSRIREAAGLPVQEFGVPIDVLWFRISRTGNDPEQLFGNINYGKVLILIPRGDYFQAGLIIRKGSFADIQQGGLEEFRKDIRRIAPYLGERVRELRDWEQIKLLSVQINRLRQWYRPGLLCIGDAAHAMSPAGGVGINLAIQDAVATANLLTQPLLQGRVTAAMLACVQQRREFPTRATQFIQVGMHKALETVFRQSGPLKAPWQLKAVVQIPGLQRITARVVGVGILPEHVKPTVRRTACQGQMLKKFAVGAGLALAGLAVGVGILRSFRKRSHGWSPS